MAGMIKTEDTESEAGSISEEERIRKLFQACDGDGDGYIDSEDLLSICRELNLEQCVGELMQELGADEHGRISYQGFLRRRLELAGQVEAATRRLGRGTATETEEEETEEETEDEESRGVGRRRAGSGRTWGCGECGAHRGQEGEDEESCAREGRESSGDSGFRRTLVVIDSATPSARQQEYRQPTSSENSLGAGSGGRQERWEFDSGARDLSPEPQAPPPGSRSQQQAQGVANNLASTPQGALATPTQTSSGVNTNPPIPQGGTASLLDMANKLHQAALASLKSEIQDLTGQLKAVTQERDFLERSLSKAQLEKLRLVHDAEERLDSQAQRYEGRLTELHCVIAELSRKIRGHTSRIITEEEEEADEDDSTTAAEEDEDEEVDEIDDEDEEVDEEDGAGSQSVAADTTQDDLSGVGGEEGVETETQDCCELESGRTELVDGEGTVVPDDATDHTQTQDLVAQEVRREEEEEEGLEQQRRLHRKVKELQGNLQQLQIITPSVAPSRPEMTPLAAHGSGDCHGRNLQERSPCCPAMHSHDMPRRSPRRISSVPDRGGMVDRWVGTVGEAVTSSSTSHFPTSPQHTSPPQFLPPPPPPIRESHSSQPKVAERVRIQRVGDSQNVLVDHGNITPSEMVDLGVCCNSRTAEHLVRDIREESSAQELRHATQCGYIGGSCSSAMSPNAQYQWKGETGPSQSCITRLPMESSQISEAEREISLQPSCGCLPVLRALELEVERQAGRAEAHRATSELTALSLEECRSACERQALVLSRRGSHIVGLATALSFALPLCRACFILSRVLEIRHSSGKKAKAEEETTKQIIASSSSRPEPAKMKSRIPEFQNKGGDSKGSERLRLSKKGDASASGGSTGSGRSAEPEKSWLCRKREELGRSWGSKKDEGSKGGGANSEQVNEEGKKGRETMFVDEGGYGKILGHGSRSSSTEEGQKGGKGGEGLGGSASSSSGGEESVATRADVGCGGADASDLVRLIEAEAASLVENLDCKMRLLNLAECRTEEMAEECSGANAGVPEEDWVLSWDDFNWIESLGKEEDGSPDMLRRLGKHISILLKSLSSCGVGLKKAKDMAADASASENELGLPPSNINPELYLSSQGQPGRKADLEVAVLMQELMAMREERAVLRTRIHALEGEREELGRVCMLLKLGRGEEAAEAGAAIVPHIPSTKDLIRLVEESGKIVGSIGESSERLGEGGAMVDNVSREQWLETRLQELALTLEQVATSADVRLRQSTAVMNDLRRTNGTLEHSLERCRRRYQQRLKTLETQMENLIERHASQVRTLRQRISQLEDRSETGEAGGGCKVGQTGGRLGEVSL